MAPVVVPYTEAAALLQRMLAPSRRAAYDGRHGGFDCVLLLWADHSTGPSTCQGGEKSTAHSAVLPAVPGLVVQAAAPMVWQQCPHPHSAAALHWLQAVKAVQPCARMQRRWDRPADVM